MTTTWIVHCQRYQHNPLSLPARPPDPLLLADFLSTAAKGAGLCACGALLSPGHRACFSYRRAAPGTGAAGAAARSPQQCLHGTMSHCRSRLPHQGSQVQPCLVLLHAMVCCVDISLSNKQLAGWRLSAGSARCCCESCNKMLQQRRSVRFAPPSHCAPRKLRSRTVPW